jgi:uncharacterized protein YjbI with pentapeptide repeats
MLANTNHATIGRTIRFDKFYRSVAWLMEQGGMAVLNRKSFFDLVQGGCRDFRGIHLRGVTLNESSALGKKIKKMELHSCDFSDAIIIDCNFVGLNLSGSRFVNAGLSESNFARTILTDCNFNHASLSWCNLNLADFHGAKLTYADLSATNIYMADFSNTLLTGARFDGAILKSVRLDGARAAYLTLNETSLIDLDLSVFVNARITGIGEPSDIDWQSIIRSLHLPHDRLKRFFVQVGGMPNSIAEWMIGVDQALERQDRIQTMQSTFISYGAPDEKFAIDLRDELDKNGVTTFLFRDNAIPGQKLHRMMRDGVNNFDRVILICSEASLDRPGVLNEIEETLQREARSGGESYLIPIRLDDYVFKRWNPQNPDTAQAVRDRVIGDFRSAKRSKKSLAAAMGPLLDALKR